MSKTYDMSPNPHTKLEVEEVTKRRYRISCGNCGYSWVSESQAEKRIACSRCKTSIILPPNLRGHSSSDVTTTTSSSYSPPLVKTVKPKSVQEFREISDHETSIDYRMFTEIQKIARQNEAEIIKILDDLDSRDPLPSISEQQNKTWDEKMKHMTYGQKFIFMLSILRETFQKHYDRLNGDIPPELVVHFERCLDRQRIYAGFLHEMEVYELKKAQESDRRNLHKKPKKVRSRKIASKRRRLKLKC